MEVCESYKKNLDSFKNKFNRFGYSFLTARGINAEFKDFSKPKWENLLGSDKVPRAVNPHLKISDFFWKRDVNPVEFFRDDPSKWQGTKKQYAEAYKRYFYFRHEAPYRQVPRNHFIAEIDIDNDGTPEPVYLDQMYSTPTLLLVLLRDYSDIDYEKTKLVQIHLSRKELGLKDVRDISPKEKEKRPELKNWTTSSTGDALHILNYGVFIYKNKTYFDFWGLSDAGLYGGEEEHQRLRIFFSEKGKTTEICTIKLVSTYK